MNFDKLTADILNLSVEEKRFHSENRLEIVVAKQNFDNFRDVLTSYFGTPYKSAGKYPNGTAKRIAKPYGGIRREQTLYLNTDEIKTTIVLIWPWGCGVRATLKILIVEKAAAETSLGIIAFFKSLFAK